MSDRACASSGPDIRSFRKRNEVWIWLDETRRDEGFSSEMYREGDAVTMIRLFLSLFRFAT